MAKTALIPLALLLAVVLGSIAALLARLDAATVAGILTDPEIRFAIAMSMGTAVTSLGLAVLIAVPAAWALTRGAIPGGRLLHRLSDLALDLPMVTPPLVTGMGLLLLLGQTGPVGAVFPAFARSLFSPLGVIIAQTYVACAILVRSAASALSAVDREYVHAAHGLGLSPWKAFLLVEIPLCWRPLTGGCILALSRALGEFGATLMLAGATRMKTETLPMAVFLNIASGDFTKAIACAALLIIIACALLLALHAMQGRDRAADGDGDGDSPAAAGGQPDMEPAYSAKREKGPLPAIRVSKTPLLRLAGISGGLLHDVSLDLPEGACLGVGGPSGSGKTTLLRIIAGTLPHGGRVEYAGRDITGLPPWRRPFRRLDQRLYLFPYLTVDGNLRLAQYAAGQPDDPARRAGVLARMGIAHLADRLPRQISGGEQQRAALARAVVGAPRLLLLDEPFSSLDWELRQRLWDVLRDIRATYGVAMLLVSHEPRELDALADARITLRGGRLAD
ncbi:ABC transporter permease [Nitratidesulfovibrio sp. D1]|uniref:ABC transporter permease n=1 Tax=Nitratidesulfovibrio sp. D1 TaxID=3440151 RepID=UPI003EBCCA2C